ncbi:MAG: DNA polymerase Y family protein [Phycisphaerae bacterium]|nr:DNA polymerase Y family protein [Phycisphaerae bacterium]
MRRVLSLWFPTFATDLIKRRRSALPANSNEAVLLTSKSAGREIVARRCELASRVGVRENMDLSHARSLLPSQFSVHLEPHRPDRDERALFALACRLLKFSPLVAPDQPDGIFIDITGTELVHRGETRVIRSVVRGLRKLGVRVRLASASTFACAWALARFGKSSFSFVAPGEEKQSLAPLPVAALKIPAELDAAFREIGIERIEHVLALPRSSIASRFGLEILTRIDKALGAVPERLDPVCPPPPLVASMLFEGPTDHPESIHAAGTLILEDLCNQLTTRELGVRRLDIELRRPESAPEFITITLSRPSRKLKHIWSLVRSKLERVDLSSGIEGIILSAKRTARLRPQQIHNPALGGNVEHVAHAAWGELVDTLIDRLGPSSVTRLEPVESHLPEHTWRERSILEEVSRTPAFVTTSDRPTRLFAKPEPAEAMALVPDGPVLSLRWRQKQWKILASTNPERLGAEWWRWSCVQSPTAAPAPPDRDYFALQLETGLWIWACRQNQTGRWFVHGEWS